MDCLKKIIDPDFGLLTNLYKCEVLGRNDLERIEHRETLEERNVLLLEQLINKPSKDRLKFLDCLVDSMQQHVYNYICRHRGMFVLSL